VVGFKPELLGFQKPIELMHLPLQTEQVAVGLGAPSVGVFPQSDPQNFGRMGCSAGDGALAAVAVLRGVFA
jgi:hypothetical protein